MIPPTVVPSRLALAIVALIAVAPPLPASGAPADCPRAPGRTEQLPLALNLQGQHGVPAGVSGEAEIVVSMSPDGRLDCPAENAPAPSDFLRGEPGDLLLGAPTAARRR